MAIIYGHKDGSPYPTWHDDGNGDWDEVGGGARVGNGQCWDGVDTYYEYDVRKRKQKELEKYRNR